MFSNLIMENKKFKYYFLKLSVILVGIFILQITINGFTEGFVLNDKVVSGEYWRFLTAIFLHGSVSHLAYNLLALLFFGFALEKLIGSRKFLAVFFISGIVANLIAVNYYESSLGASGAIYGVIGCLTVIRPFMMVWAFGFIMPMFIASFLWVIGDVLRSLEVFGPTNVGSIAHLSGIVIGFIFGLMFKSLKKKTVRTGPFKIPDVELRNWENIYMKR